MDLLRAAYGRAPPAGSVSEQSEPSGPPPLKKIKINAAPEVSDALIQTKTHIPTGTQVYYNPTADLLYQPVQGPTQPHLPNQLSATKNCWTGYVEGSFQSDQTFDQQYNTYQRFGYAHDPSAPLYNHNGIQNFIGDASKALQNNGIMVNDLNGKRGQKRKRKEFGQPDSKSYLGPWAPYEEDITYEEKLDSLVDPNLPDAAPVPAKDDSTTTSTTSTTAATKDDSSTPPPVASIPVATVHVSEDELSTDFKNKQTFLEKTIFHKKERYDYQGRTYIDPPSGLRATDHDCFLPKKRIHSWTGHTKAVSAIRLFPTTGHLLLSSDLDGKVKIWDVYNKRRVLRTFHAHSGGIRDITFSTDGKQFMSVSYDRMVKLWDTESGACVGRFSNQKTPYCATFYPEDNNQFVAGYSDKKILQWDIRQNEIVIEYDRHLGPVNSLTFIDQNRKFVSTSDDKSIRVWDWGIPVEVKLINEPHMHSMPAVAMSPTGKWMAGQSLDNQILIYAVNDRFKLNKKKRFQGHLVAGYSCQPGFSADGKYVISGDSEGNLLVWDWKSQKMFKKIKAHDNVCIGVLWHPIEASKVITCGMSHIGIKLQKSNSNIYRLRPHPQQNTPSHPNREVNVARASLVVRLGTTCEPEVL